MKKIFLIMLLCLTFSSCSNDDNSECINEKNRIIDEFNNLIELAKDNEKQKSALIQQKEDKLKQLECYNN